MQISVSCANRSTSNVIITYRIKSKLCSHSNHHLVPAHLPSLFSYFLLSYFSQMPYPSHFLHLYQPGQLYLCGSSLKRYQVPILRTCKHYIIWRKKIFADVNNFKILRWEGYLGLSGWALNAIIYRLIRERQGNFIDTEKFQDTGLEN